MIEEYLNERFYNVIDRDLNEVANEETDLIIDYYEKEEINDDLKFNLNEEELKDDILFRKNLFTFVVDKIKYFQDLYNRIVFYEDYIELHDHSTLNEITNDKIEEFDYINLVEKYFDRFTKETGINVFQCGRSGRHICIENNIENIFQYDKLKELACLLELEFINELNGFENIDYKIHDKVELKNYCIDKVYNVLVSESNKLDFDKCYQLSNGDIVVLNNDKGYRIIINCENIDNIEIK